MGTSVERASASHDLSKNGAALGHPGRAGGRHGRRGGEGGRRARRRPLPRGQRPVSAGDEDLPLPRPLHVRPGEIPQAGGGAADARAVRPHRDSAARRCSKAARARPSSRRSTTRSRPSCRTPPTSPSPSPEPDEKRALDRRADRGGRGALTMGTQILMPALSPTMTEGKLARWLKHEGDEVRPATSSPRSRPTRPRWKSRRWTRASSPASWSPRAPKASRSTARSPS